MSALEQLEDHRQHPRHLGKLVGCDAVGDVGSIVVGDALRFFLNIKDDTIVEAKFQVFGAADMISSASILCEMLPGKSISDARRLQPRHICKHLGDLDRYQLPAQIWALDALQVALDSYQGLETPRDEDMDALVCRCHGVTEQQIRDAISEDQCSTVEEVSAMTFATTGCGSCRVDVQKILDDVLQPKGGATTDAAAAPSGLAGRIPLMRKINALVEQEFGPELQERSSRIELWDLAGDQVIVKLNGDICDDEQQCEQIIDRLQRRVQDDVEARLRIVVAAS